MPVPLVDGSGRQVGAAHQWQRLRQNTLSRARCRCRKVAAAPLMRERGYRDIGALGGEGGGAGGSWGGICLLVFSTALRSFQRAAERAWFLASPARAGSHTAVRDPHSERAGAGSSRAGVENGLIAQPGQQSAQLPPFAAARSLAAQAPLAGSPRAPGAAACRNRDPFCPLPPGPRCCPAPLPATAAWPAPGHRAPTPRPQAGCRTPSITHARRPAAAG